ncbi:MAG: ATP-grasp domain-containing protein [Microbacterium sp.]
MPTSVLVIDPESAGIDLIAELQGREVEVTTWTQDVPYVHSERGEHALDAELVALAKSGDFDAVIAGGESGVSAAELLASVLGHRASDPSFIFHRRDKNGMVSCIREAGLRASRSVVIHDAAELVSALAATGLPAVLKPTNSAGSDLVRVVKTQPEAEEHAAEVLGSTSILGLENHGFVVQEYLDGPQFHINTVVVDGAHLVTEVYSDLFRMVDGAPQLYGGRTYRYDDPQIAGVIDYTIACMDALGVREGSTHSEVRVTADGPVLVEFNGRLMGPCQPTDYFVKAQSYSQATVWADVLAGRAAEARAVVERRDPQVTLGFYMLSAANAGTLTKLDESSLRTLASYRGVFNAPQVGDVVTVENRTTTAEIGIVFLAQNDERQVDDDIKRIKELELAGEIHAVSAMPPSAAKPLAYSRTPGT